MSDDMQPEWLECGKFKCKHCGSIDTHFALDGTCRRCPFIKAEIEARMDELSECGFEEAWR